MEFRLIYEGPLHGQGAKSGHKWEIRRALHPQLQRLWRERPLKDAASSLLAHPALPDKPSVIVEKGGLLFAPLVTQRLDLYAELSVLLFRQQPRGTLITDGGDIDNRLKTLLDGLRVPHGSMEGRTELPPQHAQALALLQAWDGVEGTDSAAAAIYEVWANKHLPKATLDSIRRTRLALKGPLAPPLRRRLPQFLTIDGDPHAVHALSQERTHRLDRPGTLRRVGGQ